MFIKSGTINRNRCLISYQISGGKKMNIKSNLKYFWLESAVFSIILTIFLWFGYDSQNLQYATYTLNAFVLVLSLPCSLFAVLVVALANHYLGIEPFSTEGIYLSTVFLFVTGLMQWFWIARFWSPNESMFQNLNLHDAKVE